MLPSASSRTSLLYAGKGTLEAEGHKLVLRQGDELIHFPVASTNVICLEPGASVSHAAVKLCAETKTLLLWTGEQGVRFYAAGSPGGSDADKLLRQASYYLDPQLRFLVAQRVYRQMFGEVPDYCKNIDQLRGLEGARVKQLYGEIACEVGIQWHGRESWQASCDPVNAAINYANAALYGLAEAVIVAMGFSPAIGFVHAGNRRSFVFDVADCLKFKTTVPLAMRVAHESSDDIASRTRRRCRETFCNEQTSKRIVAIIQELLPDESAGCPAD